MTRSRSHDRHALDDLGMLRAVIDAGSFLGAGATLGLTQSAVSRAVARLEDRVGVRMFQRSARAIALTEEGRRFYEAVAPHLTAIEDATIEAGDAAKKVRGRLRVNVDGGIGQFVLMPHLASFLERHPELVLELEVRDRMGDLVREGFDVSVRFGTPEASALKSRLLLRSKVVTCASPAYLAAHGTPKHPNEIGHHRVIHMRNPATGAPFAWEFVRGRKAIPVEPRGQLIVNASGNLISAAVQGQGVAQLIELYVRELLAAGELVQVLPDWADETYPLYAYHHAAQLMSAKVRAFLDFVVAVTARAPRMHRRR